MAPQSMAPAFIVSARRTALGRVGGLHRVRRVEDLAAPVVTAALADAKIAPDRVDEIVLGNATAGSNPARLIALVAGLPAHAPASTIDRQCGSGFEAILSAVRSIGLGEANVMVAGGVESLSTAPWRIAKPRSLYQRPHFIGLESDGVDGTDAQQPFEAGEALARRRKIDRGRQDAYALRSHLNAAQAREARRFVGEIVPMRSNPDEARDQSSGEPAFEDLARMTPFLPPSGTLTPGNTSAMHDGAAIAVIVSEEVWLELGQPPALKLVASASTGVSVEDEAEAPIAAMQKLYGRLNGFDRSALSVVEMSESSAAQAIALADALGIDEAILNPDGGAIVRGHPFGASGAVLVARLFTTLARNGRQNGRRYGAAVQGGLGGLGLAALFEAV